MSLKGPWVAGPYPIIETPSHRTGFLTKPDPTLSAADTMTLVHNCFIRSLNSLMLQCHPIAARGTPTDVSDYAQYGLCLSETVHHHHVNEEKLFFTPLEKALNLPGCMDANIEQHRAFEEGHDEFQTYCEQVKRDPGTYDPLKMEQVLRKFGDPLAEHMHSEIETLVDLKQKVDPDGVITNKCMNDWDTVQVKVASKDTDYPLILGAHDATYENKLHTSWPPIPFFVPYLVEWVFARKYRGAWRFSPCRYGQPRDLPFSE